MRDRAARVVPALLTCLLVPLAGGCSRVPAPRPAPRLADLPPDPAPPFDDRAEPAEAVLSLVPQQAEVVTVTDWDAVRVQLGQPDLTSEDLMTDRLEFWRRAEAEAAALTDGLLREADSRLALDYGFTQDDVDWEAASPGGGPGLRARVAPGPPLAGVRRAVADGVGPLAGARLRAADHLLVKGVAEADVWANEARWGPLVDEPATATYLRRGCVPLHEALGPDAGRRSRTRSAPGAPVTTLAPLDGFVLAFGDHDATVRVEPDRDRPVRAAPDRGGLAGQRLPQAYVDGAADPASGRIGYTVPRPRPRWGWRCWTSCRSRCATRSCRGRADRAAERGRRKSPRLGRTCGELQAMSFRGAMLRNTDV